MTASTIEANLPVAAEQPRNRPRRRVGDVLLHAYTWLVILWLMAPIAVIIIFSFNNPTGRYNTNWVGFTTKYYSWAKLSEIPDLRDGVINSIAIAVIATLGSVVLGTGIGIALGKYRFRGSGSLNLVMFAAISAPEIVLGAALLSFFVTLGTGFGYSTIIIAHIMFSLSFVAVVVRARVLTLDPSMEEAAKDLGASAWTTFWRVTFPIIFPAILSGGLLAFVLSIDDFVVTSFTNGSVQTFPLWIYGSSKLGMPPQVNVVGTLIFALGIVVAVTNVVMSRRREKR
jgi:spermidine/putrescine transport system permease protein